MKKILIASATAALVAVSGAALAQSTVVASTDLNVRSGPGPNYPVVGVIGADQSAEVLGCAEASKWCQVQFSGGSGWAYSDYLIGSVDGRDVVFTERAGSVAVVRPESNAGAATGIATGVIAGAIIGGPIGAAVGGIAGGVVGTTADVAIESRDREYIVANPAQPVYLDGEVVIGARVPNTVQYYEIPNSTYSYVNVNGQTVLVERDSGRIVQILR
jgi:uncharacterized protein YraI